VPTSTVHAILRNHIYTGDFEWKGHHLGFGVAGVLGAKFAAPDRPCVTGVRRRCVLHARQRARHCGGIDLPVAWVASNNYAYASTPGLQRGYLGDRE
jgi:acetolactate synthase I/II/III large subunit